jgi:large subunit ribosomal protein L6
MSRVGKTPIKILQGVKVDIKGEDIRVEGPKGKLAHKLPKGVAVKVADGNLVVTRDEKVQNAAALHGLTRTLIHNMVHGVHTGFTKELDIVGVGYRATVKGQTLSMTLGYSHPVEYTLPTGVSVKVENNTHLVVTGADKILLGMVAAKIRSFKEPEPYQGKGVKYTNEHIVRKQGKAAGAK